MAEAEIAEAERAEAAREEARFEIMDICRIQSPIILKHD